MCAAKELQILNRLGLRLAKQNEHRAALVVLAQALRVAIRIESHMFQAKIHSNLALAFYLNQNYAAALRQTTRSMTLVQKRVGMDNKFYRVLQKNLKSIYNEQQTALALAA